MAGGIFNKVAVFLDKVSFDGTSFKITYNIVNRFNWGKLTEI